MSVRETIGALADGRARTPAEGRQMDGSDRDDQEGERQPVDTGDMGQGSFEESFAGARDEPASRQGPDKVSVEHRDEPAEPSR